MAKFGIVYDARMMDHSPPKDNPHPEVPGRVGAIWDLLVVKGIIKDSQVQLLKPREICEEELLRCHDARYLQKVRNKICNPSGFRGDMYSSSGTLLAASLAAGSSIVLAEAMEEERITSGYAIVRPPGHHAKCGSYGGFCFYNNAMLAATYLTEKGKKVYVVDWDVHLGDGSIGIMKSERQCNNDLLRYFSIHRWDYGRFYPGGPGGRSGFDASGRVLKVGFEGPQGDQYYLETFIEVLLPSLRSFNPDIIIISAGFDAAAGDPLGECNVSPTGYAAMIKLLKSVTPRIGMILEGGYNLNSISYSSLSCVRALLENDLDLEQDLGGTTFSEGI